MSLLDRLRPAWQRSDWQVRRAAVREMISKYRLRQIAGSDPDERVREEASRRLKDPNLDEEIASRRRTFLIATLIFCLITLTTRIVLSPPGAGGMGLPPTNSESLRFVDGVVEQLEFANVAFNAPPTVRLGERTIIELLLSSSFSIEELQKHIAAAGEKHGFHIRVANHMRAELWGQGFKGEAILPQEQLVSTARTTEWKWDIQAVKAGEQVLYLTLSAVFYLDDRTTPYVIKTFEHRIKVRVVWTRWIASFVGGNWQWLWTALLIPVAGWVIHKRKKKRRRPKTRVGQPRKRRAAGNRGSP